MRCAALLVLGACAARPTVALVSANAEWTAVRAMYPAAERHPTPFGEWLVARLGGHDVVFLHGGYGKVAAAGSTQYAIDRWHPRLVVNLGTCGGFGDAIHVGDIVLAARTVIYDLIEQMGSADETIADYTTALDTSSWPAALRDRVRIEPIVSGDRDLIPADLPALHARYGAEVGDWESGAIAWVAAHDHTPVWILRGVTDVIGPSGDPTYGDLGAWQRAADVMMRKLVALLGEALAAMD